MSLQFTEQVIFDHIQSNRNLREYWEGQIDEIRTTAKDDEELVDILSERLGMIYMGNQSEQNDLSGLVDAIDLMAVYYPAIAFALLGRDLQLELVSKTCKPPAELEQDLYYLLKDGKKLGPFSFAEITIKWTNEKITADYKVYLNSKSDWRPVAELVAPWTVDGNYYLRSNDDSKSGPFTDVQIQQMWKEGKVNLSYQYWNEEKKEYCPISDIVGDLLPVKPVRTRGTKESPIPILSASYIGVAMHAESAIDELFGKGKWKQNMNYGDIHGLRCWVAQLEDGSTEEVWFDYSPAAEMVSRREAGEKVGILGSMNAQERRKFDTAVQTAMDKANEMKTLRQKIRAGAGDKIETSTFTRLGGCCCVVISLAGLAVLVFASDLQTRIATIGGLVVFFVLYSLVSGLFEKRHKATALTPKQIVNRKIDAAYAEFQQINPGKLWLNTTTPAESKAAQRIWWKEQYDFNIEGIE